MRVQHLQGDDALEAPVDAARQPDLAHTAETHLSFELIGAEAGARLERRPEHRA